MEISELINNIKQEKEIKIDNDYLGDNQKDLIMLVKFLLTDDKYISYLRKFWDYIIENDLGLIKFDLYVDVLKQNSFNKNIAKYICLKENIKI